MATTKPDASAPDAEVTTKTYTVAPGRTVYRDGDTAGGEAVGPDETIDLDPKEGEKLQKLGFLRGDDGAVHVDENAGPAVVKGAEIKEA